MVSTRGDRIFFFTFVSKFLLCFVDVSYNVVFGASRELLARSGLSEKDFMILIRDVRLDNNFVRCTFPTKITYESLRELVIFVEHDAKGSHLCVFVQRLNVTGLQTLGVKHVFKENSEIEYLKIRIFTSKECNLVRFDGRKLKYRYLIVMPWLKPICEQFNLIYLDRYLLGPLHKAELDGSMVITAVYNNNFYRHVFMNHIWLPMGFRFVKFLRTTVLTEFLLTFTVGIRNTSRMLSFSINLCNVIFYFIKFRYSTFYLSLCLLRFNYFIGDFYCKFRNLYSGFRYISVISKDLYCC